MKAVEKKDICIVGAGPAGAATALKLSYMGIPSTLIDKAVFPRDKICGDALSGKVVTLIQRLDPQMLERLDQSMIQVDIWGIKFFAPNHKELKINYRSITGGNAQQAPGYVSKRIDFDHFLIEEVKGRPDIQLIEGVEVTACEKTEDGYVVKDKSGQLEINTKLLIMANGAQSQFSRKIAGLEKDPKHYVAALRAYYKGVDFPENENFIELHFIDEIIPGYFWVFPLPNGMANVGIGMRSDFIKKRGVNLKDALQRIIQNHPMVKDRFQNAQLEGTVTGYGLPLGSKRRKISGDHYMLVGDAAHLIDPLTGEGIGNAFYSGFIAAEQAAACLQSNDFSASTLTAYDKRVRRVLGSEMELSYKIQRAFSNRWVCNLTAAIISGNQKFYEIIANMQVDEDLRESLVKPGFWIRLMMGRRER